jgi:hypothetical protein
MGRENSQNKGSCDIAEKMEGRTQKKRNLTFWVGYQILVNGSTIKAFIRFLLIHIFHICSPSLEVTRFGHI